MKSKPLVCRICDGLRYESYGGEMEAAAQHCSTVYTSQISGTSSPLLLLCPPSLSPFNSVLHPLIVLTIPLSAAAPPPFKPIRPPTHAPLTHVNLVLLWLHHLLTRQMMKLQHSQSNAIIGTPPNCA